MEETIQAMVELHHCHVREPVVPRMRQGSGNVRRPHTTAEHLPVGLARIRAAVQRYEQLATIVLGMQ